MKTILLILCFAISASASADTKLSLMGSLLYNTPDVEDLDNTSGVDEEAGVGFGVGLRALMGIQDQLHFRSGAGIVQKKFGFESTGLFTDADADLSFTYLNIPLTLYWKASPQVGFFGGIALNAKLDDDCEISGNNVACPEDEALVFPAIIGFDFSFTESFGMELSYEYGLTETAEDLRVHSAVASFLYHLD